jgi:5-methylcytosine-specific restriction endonuclease McrA
MTKHPLSPPLMKELQKIKSLDDDRLERHVKKRATDVRLAMALTVAAVTEIARRKVHLARAYDSLAKYIEAELKISHSSAYRYAAAAWLCLKLPESLGKLESGSLSLEAAADLWRTMKSVESRPRPRTQQRIQPHLGIEPATESSPPKKLSQADRREVLKRVENRSRSEVKRELQEFRAEQLGESAATTRPRGGVRRERGWNEVSVYLSDEELQLFERLRDLTSHACGSDWNELVIRAAEESLDRHDPIRREERRTERKKRTRKQDVAKAENAACPRKEEYEARTTAKKREAGTRRAGGSSPSKEAVTPLDETYESKQSQKLDAPPVPRGTLPGPDAGSKRKRPSVAKQAELLKKGLGCEHRDVKTGRVCGSKRYLDFDHIVPLSEGGTNAPENFRLLCASHNRNRTFLETRARKGG